MQSADGGSLQETDGSRKIEIPITRNYATLMQSPSHHVENAFVEALRQHGFHEPFLYAYRLRAAGLTGAPNPRAPFRERLTPFYDSFSLRRCEADWNVAIRRWQCWRR